MTDILPIDPKHHHIHHDCGVLGVEWSITDTIRFVRNSTGKPIHPGVRFLLDDAGKNVISTITEPVPLKLLRGSWGVVEDYDGGPIPNECCFFAMTYDRREIKRLT